MTQASYNITMRAHPLWMLLALTACETPPAKTTTTGGGPEPVPTAVPRSGVARFFPLVPGNIYSYVTMTDDGQGMMVTRVTRADDKSGDLQGPEGTKTFHYAPDGIMQATETLPVYVLKEPLAVGTTWRGRAGATVKIVEVNAKITVPAGAYTGCIKTVEERGGDVPIRQSTVFCPDTGVVMLEATSGMKMHRAELKSYGPPIDLGPDGVTATPPETPPSETPPPAPQP